MSDVETVSERWRVGQPAVTYAQTTWGAAMYARVTTAQGAPEQVDELFRQFQAQVAPVLRRLPGYAGVYLLVDRAQGKVMSLALWASLGALQASEAAVRPLRAQAAQTLGAGAPPSVEIYEVIAQE